MTKLFNFTEGQFDSLLKQKIPLECVFLLEMLVNERDVDNEPYLSYLQRLQRKGYIDGKQQLTEYGTALYKSLFEDIVAVKPRRVAEKNDLFEQWWETYPMSNDFTINGRHFQGSQMKRMQKAECQKLFNILCNSFKGEDIIAATAYHINNAKEISFKKRENQLTYIPNSLRYIREKYFEAFIKKVAEKSSAPTDFEI
jgi:hypothetical protein